jgi:cell division protein FtsB
MKAAESKGRQPSYEELLAENAALKQQLAELQALVASLSARVKELEDQLVKNSSLTTGTKVDEKGPARQNAGLV